ncbi:MAG: bifunctional glutamate N-acetyltransferase/amino-acid acetyltransferase ArgJ [Solirubrobacterales bacterium]
MSQDKKPALKSRTEPDPLFKSRWISLPQRVQELPVATLPKGFRAGGVAAGIKPSGKLDLGIVVSDEEGTTSAAIFTSSATPAPPVQLCRSPRVRLSGLRAVIVNSGNANAGTGGRGRDNAVHMQGVGAMVTQVDHEQVAVASTGVIGKHLETDLIASGASTLRGQLANKNALEFAKAITTTDQWPKLATLEIQLSDGPVILSAQAKGAGMIAPLHRPHATLLAFVETDAKIESSLVSQMLDRAVNDSFDRVSVDGQLSTNDSVFLLASGASGVEIDAESLDHQLFQRALDVLLTGLALSIVKDGEGSKRIGRVHVKGGIYDECEKVARTVADSPLVKTALNGGDPNWGRILQAVGMALAKKDVQDDTEVVDRSVDIWIEGICVAKNSANALFDESAIEQLQKAVAREEVEYEIRLDGEGSEATVYFSDLGHPYVTLNAEYTT